MLLAVFQFHDLGTLAIGMILGQGMVFWGLVRLAKVWSTTRSSNHELVQQNREVIQRLERIGATYEHLTETHVMLNQSHLAILRELQRLSPPQIAKESA